MFVGSHKLRRIPKSTEECGRVTARLVASGFRPPKTDTQLRGSQMHSVLQRAAPESHLPGPTCRRSRVPAGELPIPANFAEQVDLDMLALLVVKPAMCGAGLSQSRRTASLSLPRYGQQQTVLLWALLDLSHQLPDGPPPLPPHNWQSHQMLRQLRRKAAEHQVESPAAFGAFPALHCWPQASRLGVQAMCRLLLQLCSFIYPSCCFDDSATSCRRRKTQQLETGNYTSSHV